MIVCKGICEQPSFAKKFDVKYGNINNKIEYSEQRKWCKICTMSPVTDDSRCACCNSKLRTKARRFGKDRMESQITVNS